MSTLEPSSYDFIKSLSEQLNRPALTLVVLAHGNDPYYADTPGRREGAEWFAELWHRLGFGAGTHLRRIHYVLLSQTVPITLPIGNQHLGRPARAGPYENTVQCWEKLIQTARDARYLRLVPIEHIVDRRNDDPTEYVTNSGENWSLGIHPAELPEYFQPTGLPDGVPDPPDFWFLPPTVDQRFHVELWAEKTTQNDILVPLARTYGLNVVTASGEISLPACWNLVQRAKRIERPVRVLYVSDFDPAGLSMPVACARKIEFLTEGTDLNIQVRPVALTPEQCRDYNLPRTPLKETEQRGAVFEARYGEGATELDALEALHPGELRQILVREIDRYYDDTLDDRVAAAAGEFRDELDDIRAEVVERYRAELEAAKVEYRTIVSACNAAIRAAAKRFGTPIKKAAKRFNAVQQAIAEELDANAPDSMAEVEPFEGTEDDDPLFDSTRDYVEQVDRFKAHQGKPTEGKRRPRTARTAR